MARTSRNQITRPRSATMYDLLHTQCTISLSGSTGGVVSRYYYSIILKTWCRRSPCGPCTSPTTVLSKLLASAGTFHLLHTNFATALFYAEGLY